MIGNAELMERLRRMSHRLDMLDCENVLTAADRIEELERERDEALEQAKYHGEILDAWFDRRELGHAAVDQAVVDAASGYLRTSRAGGMAKKQSDMIVGVIQDMARLGLFADLFARATLAELEK